MNASVVKRHSSTVIGGLALLAGLLVLLGVVLYAREHYRSVPQAVTQSTSKNVEPIAGWMTVRFVARTYRVPEQVLLQALGIDLQQARSRNLQGIAALNHTTTQQTLMLVRTTIRNYHNRVPGTPAPRRTGA
jgi:hypothetical protein